MTRRSRQAILDDLTGLLRNFDGHEYSGIIGRCTRFFGDLGVASIDAVVLGEKLEQLYGGKLLGVNPMIRGAELLTVSFDAAFQTCGASVAYVSIPLARSSRITASRSSTVAQRGS